MKSKAGFTLIEALVALLLFGGLSFVAIQALLYAQYNVAAGRMQVTYNADARYSAQRIFELVYRCNRLAPPVVDNNTKVRLFYRHDDDTFEEEGVLEFIDGDGIRTTQEDNYIRFDPDIEDRVVQGGDEILVRNVSPVPGKPLFSVFTYANGLNSLKVQYHVGDAKRPDFDRYSKSGFGYQGSMVSFAVAPRSLLESVNWDQALGRQAAR